MVMEALTSDRALDEAINEGSFGSYKSLPKSSLPHSKKKHIYEGIDISAITRDILKLPRSTLTNSRQYSVSMKIFTKPPTAVRNRAKKYTESVSEAVDQRFKADAKYRNFVENRNNSDNFGRLPNLTPRCVEIPTNYNSFFSSEFERSRVQNTGNGNEMHGQNGTSPTLIRCSEDLKQCDTPDTYPTIEKLMLHIDDVKRMMGRKNGVTTRSTRKVQKRNVSRKAQSETLGSGTRSTSVTLSQCKSVGFSRHKTVLDHYPDLVAGRDVLGFTRNWPKESPREGKTPNNSKQSVSPIKMMGVQTSSTLPLIDIGPPR